MTKLAADPAEIERFVEALFRHADLDGYLSASAPSSIAATPHRSRSALNQLNCEGLGPIVRQAIGAANRAARDKKRRCVFAPPVCTFRSTKGSR